VGGIDHRIVVEEASIDEIAQEQQPVELRDRPAPAGRSQASKIGGEIAGLRGSETIRPKVTVGGEGGRPVRSVP